MGGRDAVERHVIDSGISVKNCHIAPPDEMMDAVSAAVEDGDSDILVGGGDGTVRGVAKLLGRKKRAFGVLPLGTMNLMARDMGVPPDFKEALAAYARGAQLIHVDMAAVNGEPFLCSACLGAIPDLSDLREHHRDRSLPLIMPAMTAGAIKSAERMARRRLRLTLDGRRFGVRAATLVVASNLLDRDDKGGVEAFRRSNLMGGQLGVYAAFMPGLWDKLRLFMKMGLGGWQNDSAVREWQGEALSIDTGRKTERLSLDGETMDMNTPLMFSLKNKSLALLKPAAAI